MLACQGSLGATFTRWRRSMPSLLPPTPVAVLVSLPGQLGTGEILFYQGLVIVPLSLSAVTWRGGRFVSDFVFILFCLV